MLTQLGGAGGAFCVRGAPDFSSMLVQGELDGGRFTMDTGCIHGCTSQAANAKRWYLLTLVASSDLHKCDQSTGGGGGGGSQNVGLVAAGVLAAALVVVVVVVLVRRHRQRQHPSAAPLLL